MQRPTHDLESQVTFKHHSKIALSLQILKIKTMTIDISLLESVNIDIR